MANLAKGLVGVVYPYGDPKENVVAAQHMNAAAMLYLENDTGAYLVSGDVGFIDSDGKVSKTTTQNLKAVIVVVATEYAGTDQDIGAGQSGWFQVLQRCPKVTVDGACNIGDWLVTSSTEKKAHPDSSSAPPTGTFGQALTSVGAAGAVEAILAPGFGWGYDAHKDASAGVHGQEAGSHVVGTKIAANWRFEKGTYTFGTVANDCLTHDVTFAAAFGGTPVVVIGHDFSVNNEAAAGGFVNVESITTTGFTLRFCNNSGTTMTATVDWLAFGLGA